MLSRYRILIVLLGAVLLMATRVDAVVNDFNIWINEFHYDNVGADVGEFVEVVAPSGFVDLSSITFVRYNGANPAAGVTYDSPGSASYTLNDFTVGATVGDFRFYTLTLPANGLQNGPNDGFALVHSTEGVLQALSYQGGMTASNGPAIGSVFTDVGVSESGSTPVGFSLQLGGSGNSAADFSWQAAQTATPGALNTNQTLTAVDTSQTPGGPPLPPPPVTFDFALPAAGNTTTIDFNDFTGIGFAPDPVAGQLDSHNFRVTGLSDGPFAFGAVAASGDYARGESGGGVSTGGIYAFDPAADDNRALGVQPAVSDFNPGAIFVRLPNETSSVIDELSFSVDILYNNDQARGNSFNVAYSTDDLVYTDLNLFTSPAAADALGFQSFNIAATLSGLDIQPGEFLFLRFSGADVSGSGSRDEFAIDNLILSQVAVPEPATIVTWSLLSIGLFWGGALRARRKR